MFDRFLDPKGPVAYKLKLPMCAVADKLSPIFPPTYPTPEGSKAASMYNISDRGAHPNCCTLDSEGSQANRMEEAFKTEYKDLIPDVSVALSTGNVSAMDMNHRIADAVFRTTDYASQMATAMKQLQVGKIADGIASLLPTSLVFGFWDSRGEHCKWGRMISSAIYAFDVYVQTRASQFQECKPATRDVLEMAGISRDNLDKPTRDALSSQGLLDCPNSAALGGVYVHGEIFREVTIDFATIRALRSNRDSLALQRYILGLTLSALVADQSHKLRQGCMLVPDWDKPKVQEEVLANGKRVESNLHDLKQEIFDYTKTAAVVFLPNEPIVMQIETDRVKEVLEVGKNGKKGAKGKGKAKKEAATEPELEEVAG